MSRAAGRLIGKSSNGKLALSENGRLMYLPLYICVWYFHEGDGEWKVALGYNYFVGDHPDNAWLWTGSQYTGFDGATGGVLGGDLALSITEITGGWRFTYTYEYYVVGAGTIIKTVVCDSSTERLSSRKSGNSILNPYLFRADLSNSDLLGAAPVVYVGIPGDVPQGLQLWSWNHNTPTFSMIAASSVSSVVICYKSSGNYPYISTDRGYSWSVLRSLPPGVKAVALSDNGAKIIAVQDLYVPDPLDTYRSKVFYSDDTGATWDYFLLTLEHRPAACCMSSAAEYLFVLAYYNRNYIIHISHDDGYTWDEVDTGLDVEFGLKTITCDTSGQYVLIQLSSYFRVSDDYGATWSKLSAPANTRQIRYGRDGTLYRVGTTSSTDARLKFNKSTNHGSSWSTAVTIEASNPTVAGNGAAYWDVSDFCVSHDGNRIFVISTHVSNGEWGNEPTVWRSEDGGATWEYSARGGTSTSALYPKIVCPDNGGTVFAYFDESAEENKGPSSAETGVWVNRSAGKRVSTL